MSVPCLTLKALRKLVLFFAVLLMIIVSRNVAAVGTPANTNITNTATLDYIIGGTPATASASASITIAELLDVNVLWQDGNNVNVMSPSSGQILTFLITNLGNGVEDFILNVSSPAPAPQFDPLNMQIWEDTDEDGLFNPINDTQIVLGGTINLNGGVPADESINVFVLSDTPSGLADGDLGDVRLIATSATAEANSEASNIGAIIAAGGDGGVVDALVGTTGAQHNDDGFYEVVPLMVTIDKTSTVIDNRGGNLPYPGSIIRYTLAVAVSGNDPVNNLLVTDVIPANTAFNNTIDSIRVDGVLQTNADDVPNDYSNFNAGNNMITVDLSEAGSVSITPPATITITFDVSIN